MAKFNIKAQAIPTVASAYADIIGTTDNQIVEIRNELIIEDNSQRFQIHDETIEQLAERIAKDGQLSPCIVTPLPNGKYELIDGRHRRRAVIKAKNFAERRVETREQSQPISPTSVARNGSSITLVDKLSTQIRKHELYYQDDKNDTFPVESVDKELLTVICEFVINCTRVDYFIFRQAYDAKDVWNYWYSQYVLTRNGKSCTYKGKSVLAEWCAANHMFRIVIDGKVFIMLHKTLEQVVRRYIRENYTIERILSVIKEKP